MEYRFAILSALIYRGVFAFNYHISKSSHYHIRFLFSQRIKQVQKLFKKRMD